MSDNFESDNSPSAQPAYPAEPLWVTTREEFQAVNDVKNLFTGHFGEQPTGVWSAPGRANLIGEHVDYAAGICLPFALVQRTYVAASVNHTGSYRIISRMVNSAGEETIHKAEIPTGQVGIGKPANWSGYVVGTIWSAIEAGTIPPLAEGVGLDIAIESDVPLGAGLSSSAALECSTAIAAWELLANPDSANPNSTDSTGPSDEIRDALMYASIRAENEVVGASTGGLDQRISLFGQDGHVLAIDFGRNEHYQVPFDLTSQNLAILVTNTNALHSLNDGQYASRRAVIDGMTELVQQETGHETLRAAHEAGQELDGLCERWASENNQDPQIVKNRVAHVTGEIQRTARSIELLKAGDMEALGQAINDSHASLRDLYEVSCPELNLAAETALANGALGSRMVGGGFGGSTIALLPVNKIDAAVSAINRAFADAGYNAPEFSVAVAGDGAHKNC